MPTNAWQPPTDWRRVSVIDAHTEGEPLRVIVDGMPAFDDPARGETMPARRRWAESHLDDWRRAVMLEPRGHADMYGCIMTPPVTPGADFGVLFLHNDGWSTMCGHGIIGVVTVALETGMIRASSAEAATIGIDTPVGRVDARATIEGGRVRSVAFTNVPSFVVHLDREVEVEDMGRVRYDLAFGGAYYAYVDAAALGVSLDPAHVDRLIAAGRAIKRSVAPVETIVHPGDDDLGFLYGTIFVGPPSSSDHHSRNVCIFADGEVDRSPTGTGVSGRLAIHHARGEVAIGESIVIESILGTTFAGRVLRTTRIAGHGSGQGDRAIVPEVTGSAYITGRAELLMAPDDPLAEGFLLR